jgi:hypothetical protein
MGPARHIAMKDRLKDSAIQPGTVKIGRLSNRPAAELGQFVVVMAERSNGVPVPEKPSNQYLGRVDVAG